MITAGGGFSVIFSLPDYQKGAVQSYLDRVNASNSTQYPFGQRAVPDVSAIGAWVNIVLRGNLIPVFGTSISAPVFSSLVSLVNDRRLSLGTNTIQNMNSFVYESSAAFVDVAFGNNCGAEQASTPCNYYVYARDTCYDAILGWDPASGVGTPRFPSLLAAAVVNAAAVSGNASKTGVIVGASLGGAALLAAIAAAVAIYKKKQGPKEDYSPIA